MSDMSKETVKKADELTDAVYKMYGSGIGCLFGLKPDKRPIVEAIIRATLNLLDED